MADPRPGGLSEIVTTPTFERWIGGLGSERAARVSAAMLRVARGGPLLGRPRVDSIQGSRLHNLKELRLGNTMRVLFAFDPNRRAVMLVGGDKAGSKGWYRDHIRVAEREYARHLRSVGKDDRCLNANRDARTR